jgi:hypothetical protein
MVRTRRESHHCDGITDPKRPQPPFATKSAQSGHPNRVGECLVPSMTAELSVQFFHRARGKQLPSNTGQKISPCFLMQGIYENTAQT